MVERILAKNIERLRKQKNLTQKQLAKVLNISSSTLSNYETQQRIPDIDIITNIAKYFQISIDDLMKNENITIAGSMNYCATSRSTNSIKYYRYETLNLQLRFLLLIIFVLFSVVHIFLIPNNIQWRNIWLLILLTYIVFMIYFLFTDRYKLIHLVNINDDEQLMCIFSQNKDLQKVNQNNVIWLTTSTLIGLVAFAFSIGYLNQFYGIEELAFFSLYPLIMIITFIFILYKNLTNRYVNKISYTDFISKYGLFKYKFLMIINQINIYLLIAIMIYRKDSTNLILQVSTIAFNLYAFVSSSYLWVQNTKIVRKYQQYRINTKTNEFISL